MEFRRYDGIKNSAPQKKIDKELAICPFCGEESNWSLNVQNLTSIRITYRCEKCGGKLYTECKSVFNIDNLQVVDLGDKNINNLTLNESYNIMSLQYLAKNSDKLFEEKGPPLYNNSSTVKNRSEDIGKWKLFLVGGLVCIVTFLICAFIFWGGNNSGSKLETVRESTMSVEEVFGDYYITIEGSVKNTSSKLMDYVSITFTLYDSNGNVVGTAIANQAGLGAGETWVYSAIGVSTTNRPVVWKATDVTVLYD